MADAKHKETPPQGKRDDVCYRLGPDPQLLHYEYEKKSMAINDHNSTIRKISIHQNANMLQDKCGNVPERDDGCIVKVQECMATSHITLLSIRCGLSSERNDA